MQALVLALTLATICKRERASFCQLPYPIHASHNVPLLDAAIRARYDSLAVLSTNTNCLRALRYLLCYGAFPGCVNSGGVQRSVGPCYELCRYASTCGFPASAIGDCLVLPRAWPQAVFAASMAQVSSPGVDTARTLSCLFPEDNHFSPHSGEGFPDPERFDFGLVAASGVANVDDMTAVGGDIGDSDSGCGNRENSEVDECIRADYSLQSIAAELLSSAPLIPPPLPQVLTMRGANGFGISGDTDQWANLAFADIVLQGQAPGRRLLELGTGRGLGTLRLAFLAQLRAEPALRHVLSFDTAERRGDAALRGWRALPPGLLRFEIIRDSDARLQQKVLRALWLGAANGPNTTLSKPSERVRPAPQSLLFANCGGMRGRSSAARVIRQTIAALVGHNSVESLRQGVCTLGGLPLHSRVLLVCAESGEVQQYVNDALAVSDKPSTTNQAASPLRVVELYRDLRVSLHSTLRALRLELRCNPSEVHAKPKIAIAPSFQLYWGWPESSLRSAPRQCAHRCELHANSTNADYWIFPAHALDASDQNGINKAIPPTKRGLLVCQEPWCHGWVNRSHPRVASVLGYHRNFDFWLPARCPELLDLVTHGAPPAARSVHAAKVAAFVSNCNTPVRQAVLQALMGQIPVDSYGQCLHNRAFNSSVEHGFFGASTYLQKHQAARGYPFVVAMENTELPDYVTEKVYDALFAGAIPIYLGAPNILDYIPSLDSLLLIRNFTSPVPDKDGEELLRVDLLANEIRRLLKSPRELQRKRLLRFNLDSPVLKRCRLIEKLGGGSIIPPSAALLRHERQYDRMAYTFCGACEAALASRERF